MDDAFIPDWLDETFLSSSLQGGDNSEGKVKITDFTASLAAPAGNNYGSYVLRVKLKYTEDDSNKEKSLSLIIKSEAKHSNEKANELIGAFKFIESTFYYQFLPEARKLCEINFTPKDFYASVPAVVVLEDLRENGFIMADRRKQLDLEHCRLYAVAAANLHAVSVAVHKVNPEVIESIGKDKLFSEEGKGSEIFQKMLPDGLECIFNYMSTIPDYKNHLDLIQKFSPHLWKTAIETVKQSNTINVLNQGDPWVTNMMFRYDDDGKVVDMKLLDFQALKYGSPVHDLIFFFWCGANNDVREDGYEEFFRLYCDTLNDKLEQLGCSERLTYDELMEEVKEFTPLSLLFLVTSVPPVTAVALFDFDNAFEDKKDEDGKVVNRMAVYYTDEYCATFLRRQFKQLENLGAFDYLSNKCLDYK